MVDVPGVTPVTIPVLAIVAMPVELLLHMPPPVASVKLVVAPVHTVAVPVILPAFGNGLTVMVEVALALPQPFVTV